MTPTVAVLAAVALAAATPLMAAGTLRPRVGGPVRCSPVRLSAAALAGLAQPITRDMQVRALQGSAVTRKLMGGSAPTPPDAGDPWQQGIVLSALARSYPAGAAPDAAVSASLTIYDAMLGRGMSVIDPGQPPAPLLLGPKGSVDPYITVEFTPPGAGVYMVTASLRLIEQPPPLLYASTVTPMIANDSPADGRPTQWTGLVGVGPGEVGKLVSISIVRPANGSDLGSPATFTQVTLRRF